MKKSWQALLGGVLFYSVSSLLVKATASGFHCYPGGYAFLG